MRVKHFADWLEDAPINQDRGSARDWRVAFNTYRTDQLIPAFRYIRRNDGGPLAHQLEYKFGQLRHKQDAQYSVAIADFVGEVNRELDAIALNDAGRASFIGVPLPVIKHRNLPAYDVPCGRMTRNAVHGTGGANDIAAIRRVLKDDLTGERSAPVNGFPHFHVAGLATNVMSIEHSANARYPSDILAFTGHIDMSQPGQTELALVVTARTHAQTNGYVWVAIINDTLHRVEHP